MSDPITIKDGLESAREAFIYRGGDAQYEEGLNPSSDAYQGEVEIQKACRMLELAYKIDEIDGYYGAILENSFIVIEQTLQGYLIGFTATQRNELRKHDAVYNRAKDLVSLEIDTVEEVKRLYDERRTKHYYETTVTTKKQAASSATDKIPPLTIINRIKL